MISCRVPRLASQRPGYTVLNLEEKKNVWCEKCHGACIIFFAHIKLDKYINGSRCYHLLEKVLGEKHEVCVDVSYVGWPSRLRGVVKTQTPTIYGTQDTGRGHTVSFLDFMGYDHILRLISVGNSQEKVILI